MSGIIAATLASLLLQQATPHPSTLEQYQAPTVRPFEPSSNFGREVAEGDGAPGASRSALAAPVKVEAYARSYEFEPTDAETAYEQGVASAEVRTDQTAGPMDGVWRITDSQGRVLYDVMLVDGGFGPAEGGWRGGPDAGGATALGGVLTLEGVGVVTLEQPGPGRGRLTRDGRDLVVMVSRPN